MQGGFHLGLGNPHAPGHAGNRLAIPIPPQEHIPFFLRQAPQVFLGELKNVNNLVLCAVLAAMAVILGIYTIRIGEFIKIGFSTIPNQIVACLFGPATAAIFGGILDILKFIASPDTGYFPGFTLSGIIAGFIYGSFYYKKNPEIGRAHV